jgi:hypothetical protein
MPLRCATMNSRTSAEYVFCTGKDDGKKVKKKKSEPKPSAASVHSKIKKDIKEKNVVIKQQFKKAQKEKVAYNKTLDMSNFLTKLNDFKKSYPGEKKLIKDLTGLKSALVVEERKRNK